MITGNLKEKPVFNFRKARQGHKWLCLFVAAFYPQASALRSVYKDDFSIERGSLLLISFQADGWDDPEEPFGGQEFRLSVDPESQMVVFFLNSEPKIGKLQVYNMSVFRYQDAAGSALIFTGTNHTGRLTECMSHFFRRDSHEVAGARVFHGRLKMLKGPKRLILVAKRGV